MGLQWADGATMGPPEPPRPSQALQTPPGPLDLQGLQGLQGLHASFFESGLAGTFTAPHPKTRTLPGTTWEGRRKVWGRQPQYTEEDGRALYVHPSDERELGTSLGLWVWGLGFKAQGVGLRAEGLGFGA